MAGNNLPLHPTARHPLTGEPIRALWVDPADRARWPIMGGAEGDGGDGGSRGSGSGSGDSGTGSGSGSGDGGAGAGSSDQGFPQGTPLEQMTAQQQAAYWKHQSRKHEGRAKQFGNLTAEELATLREKAGRQDALEEELASDKDKAVAEAKRTTQAEADNKYLPMLAKTAFEIAIGDRKTSEEVSDFLADLNLTRFVKDDGSVDTAKVLARVEQFAPATGTITKSKGPIVHVHGGNGGQAATPGDQGRAMAEKRFGKKS